MRIKYIKDAPRGKAGSTDTVTDFEANALITLGYALIDNEPPPAKPKTKSKAKATTKTDNG